MKTIHYHSSFFLNFKKIKNTLLFFNFQENLLHFSIFNDKKELRYISCDHNYVVYVSFQDKILFLTIINDISLFEKKKKKIYMKWVDEHFPRVQPRSTD